MLTKARIAVLVSGGGTNLQALIDRQAAGELPHGEICLVISNRRRAYALERAKAAGIETAVLSKVMEPDSERYDVRLRDMLVAHGVDMVLLAGFLGILGPHTLAAYENRVVNIHPALIPSFCGKGFYGLRVHEEALRRGVKVTGATAHLVNLGVDEGPILLQKAVEVHDGDTPEELQQRVMREAEWIILPKAAEMIAGRIVENRQREVIHMHSTPIDRAVSAASYPGRSIIIGMTPDGEHAMIAYFIMGRSVNSRNRVFVAEGDGIRTQAFDPSKLSDPSLVIYAPVRVLRDDTIVTNGDQTDTIRDCLAAGGTFEQALRGREFEPDAPHYTPRISGIVHREDGSFSYRLSILKSLDGSALMCQRQFFEYDRPVPGVGHYIHTYQGDGNPLPSFSGEPERVTMCDCIDEFAHDIWEHLDADNRVSLFVRRIDLRTGESDTRIINKNA